MERALAEGSRHDYSGEGWFTRERLLTLVLLAGTTVLIYVCYLLVLPFLPALTWALALAVTFHPLRERVANRISNRTVSAILTVSIILVIAITPIVFVSQQIATQASEAYADLKGQGWREVASANPKVAPLIQWVDSKVNIEGELDRLGQEAGHRFGNVVKGTLWGATQLLITIFTLFYFFRDERVSLSALRRLVPLKDAEFAKVMKRTADTIYATLYGSVATAAVQGTMGGLMFWILGLPGPALWGFAMFLLSVIPMLGAPLVWIPAAISLLMKGSIAKALILATWGALAMGLIDNFLYPILVGNRIRLHPLPIFFALVGGLVVFGASGLVLGPLALALCLSLIDVWRIRTVGGQAAEESLT